MKEYIERESLRDEIRSLSMSITGLRWGKSVLTEYMKQYREGVLRIIDEHPAADVVEVVRCKDCKYLERTNCFCECTLWIDRGEHHGEMSPNDFCSYGERR